MKEISSPVTASSKATEPMTRSLVNHEEKKSHAMKYTIVLLAALATGVICLVASTTVDHLLIERLFIACTIVFCTMALKAASVEP